MKFITFHVRLKAATDLMSFAHQWCVPGQADTLKFDLEIRFTYRSEEDAEGDADAEEGKDEFKTFTFWVRVCAGEVA